MVTDKSISPLSRGELPSHEQVFEWARQVVRERNWKETAQCWAVLREAYPRYPATWF